MNLEKALEIMGTWIVHEDTETDRCLGQRQSEAPTSAQMLLDTFGFIVIGSTHPMKIGQVIPGTPFGLRHRHDHLNHEVVVFAKSNLQEAEQQVKALGGKIPFEQFKYYYRAIAE